MTRSPAALMLQLRGATPTWWLGWAAAWIAATLSARIGIPPVDPSAAPDDRALAQLGALGLCLPLILVAALLRDHAPWLTGVSPRSDTVRALSDVLLVDAIAMASVSAAAVLFPADVPWPRVVSLFAVLIALTLLSGAVVSPVWAAVPGPVLVVVTSVRGAVPWEWNLVYNPATDDVLVVAAVVAQAVSIAISVVAARSRE